MSKAKSQDTMKHHRAYVAYYRVSTDRQGKSCLGLEGQRAAVLDHIYGGKADLVAEFVEVESGKRNGRPELEKALAACKERKAVLVVAKLDRLARNTRFLLGIAESGVDVVFCDLPEIPPGPMGKFFLTLMAAVAELEAGLISQRTRAALEAAKKRGVTLGSPNPKKGSKAGVAVRKKRADQFAASTLPVIREIEASGVTTLTGLAEELNARGIPTARGGYWYASTVLNILYRAG